MPDGNQNEPTRFRPLGDFRGLASGPGFIRETLAGESKAIDGTQQRLRDARLGSPFTFRITPPRILLDALIGESPASATNPFVQAAQDNLFETQSAFEEGEASQEDVFAAQQALLNARPPVQGRNVDIMESAQRATNNFDTVLDERAQFKQTSFFATGPTRGATLTNLQDFVGANGVRFNPRTVNNSEANQSAVSDLNQALSVILQLNNILNTPALTLLVNPESMSINYQKKQQYSDRNRFNYIFQSWGEEQVRLSVSGKSAGFVVGAFDAVGGNQPTATKQVSGYQFASKWDSAAWQNLMGLFTFYRHNGYIYDVAQQPRSEAHLFIGNVEITYDQFVYIGNFENFSYSYEEGKQQGAVTFSFDFVVSFMFDLAQGGAVTPYSTTPVPSPSNAPPQDVPFIPQQEAKATGTGENTEPTEMGTSVLDDVVTQPNSSAIGLLGRDQTTDDPFGNPLVFDPLAEEF
jgi:hypothetical protein